MTFDSSLAETLRTFQALNTIRAEVDRAGEMILATLRRSGKLLMDRTASIDVLFLSQQGLLRESFSAAFAESPDIHFKPAVATTDEAVASIRQSEPNVILVDLNPSLFGVKVARELQHACPGCRILVLSSHSDPISEAQLAAVGVKGVLCKSIGIHELACAIREAAAGKSVYMTKGQATAVDTSTVRPVNCMTPRETQVLELVAQGFANKQIAAELGISIKTVEKHRQGLMCKLQAHETAGLTWHAICMGVARSSPCFAFLPA